MVSVVVDDKPQSIDALSALFDDIPVGSNLDVEKSSDYGTASTDETIRPFADKVADVRAIMEPEPLLEQESCPLETKAPEVETVPELETVIVPESEIASAPALEPALGYSCEYCGTSDPTNHGKLCDTCKPAAVTGPSAPKEEQPMVSTDLSEGDNPLGLTGDNLKAYKAIQKKYPQFKLHDGSQAFKDFYRYKVQSLKYLLTRYGVLHLGDMRQEIENIRLDKRLGDLADPVIIGQRMDEAIAGRGRVASLLSKAQGQLPAWKKTFEWLNSKVWKDHESKGAHKRDSLALEHNADMKDYYCELQGFVDSATTIDSFLKSQHDSYSRQLSCVDMREKVGIAHEAVASEIEEVSQPSSVSLVSLVSSTIVDSELDGLDTLELGTVIAKVPVGGLVERDFPGAEIESEFLDGIG